MKEAVSQLCVAMHATVGTTSVTFFEELRRKNYTTPTSYLELLNLYSSMLAEQRAVTSRKISHYSGGVNKLVETNRIVDSMKKELIDLQPVLAQVWIRVRVWVRVRVRVSSS